MCNNRVRNVGLFPDLMARDVRDGRLRPQVFAAETGLDPSWVHRLIKGDAPLPASLLAPLVTHTRNRAYLRLLTDELGLQLIESAAEATPEASLGSLAMELIYRAPRIHRAIHRWLDGPQSDEVSYLERLLEQLEKVNSKIDTLIAAAQARLKKARTRAKARQVKED